MLQIYPIPHGCFKYELISDNMNYKSETHSRVIPSIMSNTVLNHWTI